jgi:regulator of replication initiation timing
VQKALTNKLKSLEEENKQLTEENKNLRKLNTELASENMAFHKLFPNAKIGKTEVGDVE